MTPQAHGIPHLRTWGLRNWATMIIMTTDAALTHVGLTLHGLR